MPTREAGSGRRRAAASPGLPVETAGEPVFHEPWQAKAFAMTVLLHEKGLFSWAEWAEALGAACARMAEGDAPMASPAYAAAYYRAWLGALETLASRKGAATPQQIGDTADAWQRAARATPHGSPIRLGAGDRS